MAPFHPLLPTPENALAAGMGGLMLAQRAPTLQQPQLQQRQLPPQLQQQRQQRLPFLNAHASAAGALLLQQPQQLPAFWSGLISSRGGLVPYPLQAADVPQGLPPALYRLLDPAAAVELPPCSNLPPLDNRELDKLVAGLGRSKATWRRALMLHQWLQACGHAPDARLATTLIRVCSQHGQALTALGLYDWMRAGKAAGGGALTPTVFTYTAAMRAALAGNLLPRAFQVWDDAVLDGCEPDCRMATTLIEVCARAGDTDRALSTYDAMAAAPAGSRMAPSVHAYTAAMRAAAEGGRWRRALDIWDDMARAGCRPTGHAFAAVISACAAGGDWRRGAALFDEMRGRWGIKPDVVSCTALVTAFGTDGQWARAQQVVDWMQSAGIRPNVRTYTALVGALGRGGQWARAQALLRDMRRGQSHGGGAEPNAYTYSALLKAMGDQGKWQLAESVFEELEAEALGRQPPGGASTAAADHQQAAELASHPAPPAADGSLWTSAELNGALPALPSLGSGFAADSGGGGGNAPPSSASSPMPIGNGGGGFNPLEPYGLLPTTLAEQVLDSPKQRQLLADSLPDDLPGQSNCGAADAFSASFPEPLAAPAFAEGGATRDAMSDWRQLDGSAAPCSSSSGSSPTSGDMAQRHHKGGARSQGRSPLNEVVAGAMMLAYERGGQVDKCVGMLERARRLGITPSCVMVNTAMSALGKAGRARNAASLFAAHPGPDAIAFETLIAAHGLAGDAAAAEAAFDAMLAAGHSPRDYAYTALVSAHSFAGEWRAALDVRRRMLAAGLKPTVHVYNALIAAAERAGQFDVGLALHGAMAADGVTPDPTTRQLLAGLGRAGAAFVGGQQVAVSALSAAVAAAGSMLMHTGVF